MGVMEKFFQIALFLTVVLLGVNIFLSTFGYAMTGEDVFGENVYGTALDANVLSGIPQDMTVDTTEQSGTTPETPTLEKDDWTKVWEQFQKLIVGWQTVLNHIFENIDDSTTGDAAEQVGLMIIYILSLFQIVGAAYIPWALLSAWKGGGSP